MRNAGMEIGGEYAANRFIHYSWFPCILWNEKISLLSLHLFIEIKYGNET